MEAQVLILDDREPHDPRIIPPYDVEDMGLYSVYHLHCST